MTERADLLDLIRPSAGQCLGAVFLSYGFDERFFESILATLLRTDADPEADRARFLDEGRRRLRETPVVVMVDAHQYRGGHRLPFDLLLARHTVCFRPALSLVLFEDHARLTVGSGNMTQSGYGENAEVFGQEQLDYGRDATLVEEVLSFVEECGAQGEQWERLRRQVALLLRPSQQRPSTRTFLRSTPEQTVLEQFLASIPRRAKLCSVGLVAGDQPEDNAAAETATFDRLARWLKKRKTSVPVEVALAWSDNPVAAPAETATPELESLSGRLCALIEGEAGAESLSFFIPSQITARTVTLERAGGEQQISRVRLKDELNASPPRLWPMAEVTVNGPVEALESFGDQLDLRWWLFPEYRLERGEIFRRPLHGRLLSITTVEQGSKRTHLLVGAPGAPRDGASHSVVEAGLHVTLNEHLRLPQICDELVPAPAEDFYLQAGTPQPAALVAPPIFDSIEYDAARRVLRISWRSGVPRVRVAYYRDDAREELLDGFPGLQTVLSPFELDRNCAELEIACGEASWVVPIAVRNIAHLLAEEPAASITLGALLTRYAGHTATRAAELSTDGGGPQEPAPADVFAAFVAAVTELGNVGSSLGAFEVVIDGPVGLRALMRALLDPASGLHPNEAWIYGHELKRMLSEVSKGTGPLGRHKRAALQQLCGELATELTKLLPKEPWAPTVGRFYGVRS